MTNTELYLICGIVTVLWLLAGYLAARVICYDSGGPPHELADPLGVFVFWLAVLLAWPVVALLDLFTGESAGEDSRFWYRQYTDAKETCDILRLGVQAKNEQLAAVTEERDRFGDQLDRIESILDEELPDAVECED